VALGLASGVRAERRFAVELRAGSGLSIGGGDGQATLRRTPTFLEAGAVSWLDDDGAALVMGSARVELEDRVSIGGTLRAGLRVRLGDVELRPSAGIAAILAPFTLVGPEVAASLLVVLARPLSLVVHVAVDAWLFGSDLPPSTALVMTNGGIGVELAL
jgi:hypothetical protein